MTRLGLITTSLLLSSVVYADESEQSQNKIDVPSPWKSEIEFGYQSHTGNTDSRSVNSRLSAEYLSGRHRTTGEWKYYQLYKDGEEDKRQSTYLAQSDYKLGPKSYLYGNFQGVDSRYSAYFKDYTLSSGLGYQFYNTEAFLLELELGPGYRYQEPNTDEIDDDTLAFDEQVEEAIFRGHIKSNWHITKSLNLSAAVTLVAGDSNVRTDTDLNATNSITEHIALKVSYSRQYHDRVPEGLQNADSIFSINILFSI
ncbi:YdiY family protein [Vibrio aquimaris]|uniref:Salt-induced outer membrane protein n=1 Tax=Vibrio aquimaris TaxID=2587862 RepID=A0A5P9CFY6_9VIBR|nr:DUF481 domain-containing protein [Vibrio aquimaris]QFT25135.1 hypothetical protein FIV01_01550 [Vibrio aquimaris]